MAVITARALIGDGGLLRQLEARCHLRTAKSQILVSLLVTWVPIVVLGVALEAITGTQAGPLRDAAAHVRMLVATPLLLFLDSVFPATCTYVVDRLVTDDFVRPDSRDRFDRIVSSTRRHCERWLPELILVVAALLLSTSTIVGRTNLTVVDWWYALLALPLFEFMLLRALWRWALWAKFLVALSRVDLDLEATHPDQRCGVSFLRKPSLAYCALLLFAINAVLCAGWSDRFQLATLRSFIPFLLAFAVIATAIAFGPLLLFAPALHRARLHARNTLGSFAARNGRWFRNRWIDSKAGAALESADVQSLAAINSMYRDTVKQVQLVLFERKDLWLLLFAALLPIVPTMLIRIPHEEWGQMTSFLLSKVIP